MFKELPDKINLASLEKDVLKFWAEHKIFEKSISSREGKKHFTFYEGPPTANGKPGIHHVIARTDKDLICRYKNIAGISGLPQSRMGYTGSARWKSKSKNRSA